KRALLRHEGQNRRAYAADEGAELLGRQAQLGRRLEPRVGMPVIAAVDFEQRATGENGGRVPGHASEPVDPLLDRRAAIGKYTPSSLRQFALLAERSGEHFG